MTKKISVSLTILLLAAGCAGAVQDGSAAEPGPDAPGADALDAMAAAVDGEAPETSAEPSAETVAEMALLTAAVEVVGFPDASVDACRALQLPSAPDNAMHAPAGVDMTPARGRGCAQAVDGLLELEVGASSQSVLRLEGADTFPYLLQVAPGEVRAEMNAVRLLSREALLSAYERGGFEDDKRAVIVQTPVDGAEVELLVNRIDEGPLALYLDADGQVTDADRSIAGGWAVFTTVPTGIHEVFMAHAELDCAPSTVASWPGNVEGHATLLSLPHHNTHSNAFDCN